MGIAKVIYNRTIRPWLPAKLASFNGVAVPYIRLFDQPYRRPSYKQPNIDFLTKSVHPGDQVCIVGGGFGVTACVAARLAGSEGEVIVYEAREDRAEICRETVHANCFEDQVTVVEATVSTPGEMYDSTATDETVSPSDLPPADVLEIDCEGAEESIVPELDTDASAIVIELHERYGVDVEEMIGTLGTLGYEAVAKSRDWKDREDIIVVMAEKTNEGDV